VGGKKGGGKATENQLCLSWSVEWAVIECLHLSLSGVVNHSSCVPICSSAKWLNNGIYPVGFHDDVSDMIFGALLILSAIFVVLWRVMGGNRQ
jgi:hypothetical protein